MQKIIPFLWFDNNAEEAVNFYTSTFDNSEVGKTTRYDTESSKVAQREEGSVMTMEFQVEGYNFVALNGGPVFKFSPAISFFISCDSKEKVDNLYKKLSEGGKVLMPLDKYPFSERYSWVEDKYGVSWQLIFNDEKQKVIPSLLFVGDTAGKAEEAINFYISVFKNAKISTLVKYGPEVPADEGNVMFSSFALENEPFIAMDSSLADHNFTFTPAISFIVNCENQEEVDALWAKLSSSPEDEQCGWLKDKYGVSWQIVPTILNKLISDPNPDKAQRVTKAMLGMKKIDIAELEKAYNSD